MSLGRPLVDTHVAGGETDVHADGYALLGHLDQLDAGAADSRLNPQGFTSQ
jgi:hypothetical protein